jgi:uncharacterized membrane protein
MATDEKPPASAPRRTVSRWADLPTAQQAQEWEQVSPGTFDRIMAGVERAEQHDRRLDWAEMGLRAFGILSGSGTIAILGLVARHMADHGAAIPGAGIFGAGIVSIVGAIFTYSRARRDDR